MFVTACLQRIIASRVVFLVKTLINVKFPQTTQTNVVIPEFIAIKQIRFQLFIILSNFQNYIIYKQTAITLRIILIFFL